MIRAIIALVVGVGLAFGASVALINVAAPSPEPPNRPLYNYGSR